MATYTDNYQLTKPLYSENADVAAINNNMDKIDDIMHASQVSLAPAYDQNETYNTGDVVMYEFLMYECLEDEVTGVWDATKWQRTTAGEHGGGSSASEVSYDNTDSGMTATNVQDAIDELKGEIEDIPSVEANPQGEATEELTKIGIGNTIYAIVGGTTIYGKASGAVANFDDGSANPLVDLKIQITASQGSGTPSPSNPLPISGWEGANVTVEGSNLFGGTLVNGWCPLNPWIKNGVTHYVLADIISSSSTYLQIHRVAKGVTPTGSNVENVGSVISGTTISTKNFIPDLATYDYYLYSTGSYTNIKNVQMKYSTPTQDTYEAYSGTTYPISWQTEAGEVFGGTLDVTSGEGEISHVKIQGTDITTLSMDSTTSSVTTFTFSYNANGFPKGVASTIISNRFSRSTPSGTVGRVVNTASQIYFIVSTDELTSVDVAGGKQWLIDNPTEFVYEKDVHDSFEISPTQITALLGTNNIWADCGDSEVKYIRDINKAFNILWNAVMNQSNTRSLSLTKSVNNIEESDTKEIEKEETEKEIKKEGNDENQR